MSIVERSKRILPLDRTPERYALRARVRYLLFFLLSATMAPTGAALPIDDSAYTHPQRLIDIGHGRKMNLYCIGHGSPTVVFDSGLSDWGFTWALVQPRVAMLTRACVYDRAGLGYSDPSRRNGSSANMVDDLHRLLQAAAIAPPYLLVGHSLGGLNVQLYANRFPDDVAGMVLVDPSHEDAIARIDAQKHGQETRRYRAEIRRWRACVRKSFSTAGTAAFRNQCIEPADERYSSALNAARERVARMPSYQKAQLSEVESYLNGTSFTAVRASRQSYGNLPLIVLTAEKTSDAAGPEWLAMHKELAALSQRGRQQTVAGAGHYVQLDRPQIVIEAIVQMLKKEPAK